MTPQFILQGSLQSQYCNFKNSLCESNIFMGTQIRKARVKVYS
jgi:hypothetical protein